MTRRVINISENGILRLGAGGAPLVERTRNLAFNLSTFLATSPGSQSRPAHLPTRCFGSQGVQCSKHSGEARFNRGMRVRSTTQLSPQEFHRPVKNCCKPCFTPLPARRTR